MAAIEKTLPPVPDEAPADLVDATAQEVQEMNGDGWAVFEENGVEADDDVQLEFAFSAPTEEAAGELTEFLTTGADYDATATPPETEFDDWTVRGTTPEATVTAAGLDEWVRRMAASGFLHGGCQFDGWAALLG